MFLAEHATDNGEEEFLATVIVSRVDTFYFLLRSAEILVLGPQRTSRITGSGFRISFHLDWQIDDDIHGAYSNPGTQVEAQNKGFSAVSQTDLPELI